MVVPLFGWGAGDMVNAGKALYKIGQAFSETQGAESQYAKASSVLESLAKDRQRAQELIDANPTSQYTPDIKAKLVLVDAAFKEFDKHQDDYNDLAATLSSAPTSRRQLLRKQAKKVTWAVRQMNGKVETLKQAVAEPLSSINASYLHLALDDAVTLRQAVAAQKAETLQLKASVEAGSRTSGDEIASLHDTLADLIREIDDQELDWKNRLERLEALLQQVELNTESSADIAKTSTADEQARQKTIADIVSKLWVEVVKMQSLGEATSVKVGSIMDKLSLVESRTTTIRNQRSDAMAVVQAGATVTQLGCTLLALYRVIGSVTGQRVDGALTDRSSYTEPIRAPLVSEGEESHSQPPSTNFETSNQKYPETFMQGSAPQNQSDPIYTMEEAWSRSTRSPADQSGDGGHYELNIQPGDIVIAVMGVTGSGKSTFIGHFSGRERKPRIGHGIQSCTHTVDIFRCYDTDIGEFFLVDTPGFDDPEQSDTEILIDIVAWLNQAYQRNILLTGIIYLWRISDSRMRGSALHNLTVFQKLCGETWLSKVVLATTFCSEVRSELEVIRETDLKETPAIFGRMIQLGAKMFRQDRGKASGKQIIEHLKRTQRAAQSFLFPDPLVGALLADRRRHAWGMPPRTIEEMSNQGMTLGQTAAGQELQSQMHKQQEVYEEELRDLRQYLENAVAETNKEWQAVVVAERQRYIQMLQKLDSDRKVLLQVNRDHLVTRLEQAQVSYSRQYAYAKILIKIPDEKMMVMRRRNGDAAAEMQKLEGEIQIAKDNYEMLRWKVQQAQSCTIM